MGVKKIFIVLIVIVACVLIGALVLNILLPNTARALVNAIESMIFKATGLTFDFNNDGAAGTDRTEFATTQDQDANYAAAQGNVAGFNNGQQQQGQNP